MIDQLVLLGNKATKNMSSFARTLPAPSPGVALFMNNKFMSFAGGWVGSHSNSGNSSVAKSNVFLTFLA